ncbi:gustatory receptor 91 [Tribolium castaneum]|uniref:Gustatory receptor n=1 Tax=Tribolium castaneum TaxID=7070 RepID=D7EHZ0_TRICA|nr:PREDICTED: uncharacterized protein LOC107398979 [Tribolium castaneum]EFA12699.1 gustatory receptor 91 [Tribolium castaneum]|eukprot:XP_015840060.1 PREDICTED: uncharacterized protein LOC107398979 [Tribolium castaneum]
MIEVGKTRVKRASNQLFRFGQFCAICVPKITSTNNEVPRWYICYTIGVIITIGCLCIWSIFNKWNQFRSYSNFSVFLFDIITIVTLTSTSILLIVNAVFVKEKRIRTLLIKLSEIKENTRLAEKQARISILELVAVHLVLAFLYSFDLFANGITFGWHTYIFDVPNFVNEYVQAIEVLYICSYTVLIRNKISNLNTSLIHSTHLNGDIVKEHQNLHNKICNLIDEFNECFGLQILGILFVGVIYTTYTIFLLLIFGSGSATPENNVSVVYVLILYILESLLYMIFGIMITKACMSASNLIQRTPNICYKLLSNLGIFPKTTNEQLLRKELLLFAEQMGQRQVAFKVGGFLNIDYGTLYSLFGSTAMNVIILLQFQKQGKYN